MTQNGQKRGILRPNGSPRALVFIAAGLLVICALLFLNFWYVSGQRNELREDLENLEARYQKLLKDKKVNEAKSESLIGNVKKEQTNRKKEQQKAQECAAELEAKLEEFNVMRSKYEMARRNTSDLAAAVEDLKAQNQQLKDETERLNNELTQAKDSIAQAQAESANRNNINPAQKAKDSDAGGLADGRKIEDAKSIDLKSPLGKQNIGQPLPESDDVLLAASSTTTKVAMVAADDKVKPDALLGEDIHLEAKPVGKMDAVDDKAGKERNDGVAPRKPKPAFRVGKLSKELAPAEPGKVTTTTTALPLLPDENLAETTAATTTTTFASSTSLSRDPSGKSDSLPATKTSSIFLNSLVPAALPLAANEDEPEAQVARVPPGRARKPTKKRPTVEEGPGVEAPDGDENTAAEKVDEIAEEPLSLKVPKPKSAALNEDKAEEEVDDLDAGLGKAETTLKHRQFSRRKHVKFLQRNKSAAQGEITSTEKRQDNNAEVKAVIEDDTILSNTDAPRTTRPSTLKLSSKIPPIDDEDNAVPEKEPENAGNNADDDEEGVIPKPNLNPPKPNAFNLREEESIRRNRTNVRVPIEMTE